MTPAQAETIKPCPFCGEEPEKHFHEASCNVAWLSCDCDLMPKAVGDTREEAIKLWNTRHPEPAHEPSTTLPTTRGNYWWRRDKDYEWLLVIVHNRADGYNYSLAHPHGILSTSCMRIGEWIDSHGIGEWLPCLPPEREVQG